MVFENLKKVWAHSSVGPERTLHTRKVVGSNPTAPTKFFKG